MRTRYWFPFAAIAGFAALSGCSDGELSVDGAAGAIRFDALAVGQVSRYEVFVGQEYFQAERSPFEYAGGVLVAEVVDEDDDGFVVVEFFESRPMLPERLENHIELDATYEYTLRVEEGSLRVIGKDGELESRLYSNLVLPDLPIDAFSEHETEVFGWKTRLPGCACYREAFIRNAEIRGQTYARLNVVVDDQLMRVAGPGATYLYGPEDGLVRTVEYSPWNGEGLGYDRMTAER